MASSGDFLELTTGQLQRRIDKLTDFLADWGDLQIDDVGQRMVRRRVEFYVESPGSDLPIDVKTRYREWYTSDGRGKWDIAKYSYEYLDVIHKKRLAFHLHNIGDRLLVPHAHCEDAGELADDEGPRHLRAVAYDLREVHERLMKLYAGDERPDCASMLPLQISRPDM